MPLQLFLLMTRSFCLLGLVLFERMIARLHVLRVEFMSFLWLCCCLYQVWLLCNSLGICLSFLDYRLVCRLLMVYSGRTGWRYTGLITGWLSLGLGLGFLVVPKCRPIVEPFQGLQLVWRLCFIWMVHLLQQKGVLVIWGRTMFPSSWYEWLTVYLLVLRSVVVNKCFLNRLLLVVSWWLDNLTAYSRCCGAIIFACAHNGFLQISPHIHSFVNGSFRSDSREGRIMGDSIFLDDLPALVDAGLGGYF